MVLRKYTSHKIDSALSKILLKQKPEKVNIIDLPNSKSEVIGMSLFKRQETWQGLTEAIGAISFERPQDPKDSLYFDLFFDPKDQEQFWKSHQKNIYVYKVDRAKFRPLGKCSKTLDAFGKRIVDDTTPTEWVATYAMMLFFERGWFFEAELQDAIADASLMDNLLSLSDSNDIEFLSPKETDIYFGLRKIKNEYDQGAS